MVREKGFWKRERVDEALYRLLKKIKALETEDVSVYNLYGRVLAEDIVAGFDVPRFNRAAMDGYAVKAEDTFGASVSNPIMLQLAGSVEIGEVPKVVVESGMAVRIMTGAMMPEGANAVVMLEHTRLNGNFVEVLKSVTPMKNVSRVGEDIAAGGGGFWKGGILQPLVAGGGSLPGTDRG